MGIVIPKKKVTEAVTKKIPKLTKERIAHFVQDLICDTVAAGSEAVPDIIDLDTGASASIERYDMHKNEITLVMSDGSSFVIVCN